MTEKAFSRHFFVVHSFISEEARKQYLTPPEKQNPPSKTETEREWAEAATGEFARCMQTWAGNDNFFYCHWVAESEEDVYKQLDIFELEGKIVNSKVDEIHQFVSAYRNSDTILRSYPENGDKWSVS